jgi:UDP-glucose 4-epimerase
MSRIPRKRVLVTGATGFLGKSVVSILESMDGVELYTLSRLYLPYFNHCVTDLKDEEGVNYVIQNIKPDVIIHLASNPNTKIDEKNPNGLIYDNICGTHNLLRACAKLEKPPYIVFSSSVTVYGYFDEIDKTHCNQRVNPISLYAVTKVACENLLEMFTMSGDIEYISVRFPALVGVNATHGLIKDLVKKIMSDSETLDLIGAAPGSKKPYVDVDEASELLVNLALERNFCNLRGVPTIIASNEDNLTVQEIAELAMDILGKKKEIRWPEAAWMGDNPIINTSSDVVFKSNSRETITNVIKEWKENQLR